MKGTQIFGLKYTQVGDFSLTGYSDSDFDGEKKTGVSTSGHTMILGLGAVSWRSCKQSVPADSTTEAEYVAAAKAKKGNCVAQENPRRFVDETNSFNSTHDRQHFCNKLDQEHKFL